MLDDHELEQRGPLRAHLFGERTKQLEGFPRARVEVIGEHRLEVGEEKPELDPALHDVADDVYPAFEPQRPRLVRMDAGRGVEDAEGEPDRALGGEDGALHRGEHVRGLDQRGNGASVARRKRVAAAPGLALGHRISPLDARRRDRAHPVVGAAAARRRWVRRMARSAASYRIASGIASMSCETTSGGVATAATMKAPTIA